MPSEKTKSEDADGADAPEGKVPKRFSRKQVRIMGIVVIVAVLATILLWGMVPEPIYEVDQVLDDPDSFDGEWMNIKGVVVNWEAGNSNFTLADSNDGNLTIEVSHSGGFPEGFGINVTAIVKGTFHAGSSVHRLDSEEIQVGCPSKY